MKKRLLLFLVLLLLPVFVYAENCDTSNILITGIKKIDSKGYTEEIEEPTTDNVSVSTNLRLYDVGDSITYEIKIKNKTNKDYDLNKKISNSEYISYNIISDNNKVKANEEKTINLKIEYKKKVPEELYKSGKFIENKQIDLVVEDYIINPSTGKNIIITILMLLLIVISTIFIKKEYRNKMLVLLLFIPLFVEASCEYKISINSNIELRKILPNPCTYDGELVQGAEYINGQYTYRYLQDYGYYYDFESKIFDWVDITNDGWGVRLTNPDSTDPVNTALCSSINNKPIVSMRGAFIYTHAQSIDLSESDTSNVTDMSYMFTSSLATTIDLSGINTSKVTDMSNMFSGSKATPLDLTSFNTSKVTDMSYMFSIIEAANLDLSSFDTSNVTNMHGMFMYNQEPSLDLSSFNTSNVTDMYGMFAYSKATELNLTNFDTSKVTNMGSMFSECAATNIDVSSFDTSNVYNMEAMFDTVLDTEIDFSNFDTSKVISMNWMFASSKITEIDLSGFDTRNLERAQNMFTGCEATSIDISNFDTNKLSSMSGMFSDTNVSIIDLSSFDIMNNAYLSSMFRGAKASTGYCKKQSDCDLLNNTSVTRKPNSLTFVVKNG